MLERKQIAPPWQPSLDGTPLDMTHVDQTFCEASRQILHRCLVALQSQNVNNTTLTNSHMFCAWENRLTTLPIPQLIGQLKIKFVIIGDGCVI